MPVRDVRRRVDRTVGGIPSRKLRRMVAYESSIERAYIYLLEYDRQVVSYEEQPCRIWYRDQEGRKRSYIPDFLVCWRQHRYTLVECKPASQLDDADNKRKWSAAQLWCEQRGYAFAVVTEEALRPHKTLLSNIQQLVGHTYVPLTPQAKDYLLKTIQAANRPLSVAEYVEQCPLLAPRIVRSAIWHLLYTGELVTDLTQPLHVMMTVVQLASN